jgi:hypothetical protein
MGGGSNKQETIVNTYLNYANSFTASLEQALSRCSKLSGVTAVINKHTVLPNKLTHIAGMKTLHFVSSFTNDCVLIFY